MRLSIAGSAQRDIREIHRWIQADNPVAADRVLLAVHKAMQNLTTFPNMGRRGKMHHSRELGVPGLPYVIVYTLAEDVVRVVRVYHGAMRWPPGEEE